MIKKQGKEKKLQKNLQNDQKKNNVKELKQQQATVFQAVKNILVESFSFVLELL